MSKKRWFRFYIDPWFKGTTGLSPNEIAAYITILCELYDNDGIVALDMEVMPRRCGMRPTSFKAAVDALIAKRKVFFEAGFLTSKAVEEEIKSREKLVQKSAESRANLAGKSNGNKANVKKSAPYIEDRIKKEEELTLEVSVLHPVGAFEEPLVVTDALLRSRVITKPH